VQLFDGLTVVAGVAVVVEDDVAIELVIELKTHDRSLPPIS
jgi:hypothetical protein